MAGGQPERPTRAVSASVPGGTAGPVAQRGEERQWNTALTMVTDS
jgi:hypothetical protein